MVDGDGYLYHIYHIYASKYMHLEWMYRICLDNSRTFFTYILPVTYTRNMFPAQVNSLKRLTDDWHEGTASFVFLGSGSF